MGYIQERFGTERIYLTEEEQLLLKEQIKKLDEKRLDFFSLICVISSAIMLIMDFIFFNDSKQGYYLFFDSLFFIASFLVLINSSIPPEKKGSFINRLKDSSYNIFPFFPLLWSVSIAVIAPDSMLNVITFYFVLFIITFTVHTPLKKLLFYYALILADYIILSYFLKYEIFSESLVIITIICVIILPFYFFFRDIRINSQSANLRLNLLNKNLEDEVVQRIVELQKLNNSLETEISHRRIVEHKLRETLKLAESSNQLKSEFLSNISHEIRTPLNAIVGFTEMMTEDGVPPVMKKQFQELVASNTMYLLSTIDDIFDASLLKTDQIKPVPKYFNVNFLLESIFYEVNGIQLKYNKKELKLAKKSLADQEFCLKTDEYYLKKAIMRLIDNAYKFTSEGTIEIGARKSYNSIEFFVSDTGIGISDKDQVKIFEPFVQGDGSFTRGYGGSGLGLTIVKGIIQSLGADFSFSTKVNEGSTFSIFFNKSFY
jgi:signal transduction histidine kinase